MNSSTIHCFCAAGLLTFVGAFGPSSLAEEAPDAQAAIETGSPAEASAEITSGRAGVGQTSLGVRFGDNVQEYYADLLIPFVASENKALLLGLRGTFLEDLEQELNAGIVLRHRLADKKMILGANLFYDTRWTENDNTFDQLGAGVELLSQSIDIRANYYYPLTDRKTLSRYSDIETSNATRGNRQITTRTTTTYEIYEEALEGFDAEIGYGLPFMRRVAPTILYVGYYNFSADNADDISGMKARIEARVHPNVTLDAEWIEDHDLNQSDYFVGVRIHVPLDFWNGVGFRRSTEEGSRARSFDARMSEMVSRDFRIRTVVSKPTVVDQQESSSSRVIQTASDSESSAPSASSPQPTPPPRPSNCYLNASGDVVCD